MNNSHKRPRAKGRGPRVGVQCQKSLLGARNSALGTKHMAETIGSLVDKICIAELKIFHMREQVERRDVDADHRFACQQRLAILKHQRDDLARELDELARRWSAGQWKPMIYRQFKLYNDPRFRIPAPKQSLKS